MLFIVVNNFLLDFIKILEDIVEKVELMYLNYFNNLIGVVVMVDFFEEIVVFVKNYNIVVVYDFVYGGIGFDGKKLISFLEINGVKEVGIEFYIFLKIYNMVGWCVGFVVGNSEVIEVINFI